MRDWVHSLIVLRKFNKEIKERQNKSTEELKSSKKELYKLIPEAKVCGYCNTILQTNDYRMKYPGDHMSDALCGFCFSSI